MLIAFILLYIAVGALIAHRVRTQHCKVSVFEMLVIVAIWPVVLACELAFLMLVHSMWDQLD